MRIVGCPKAQQAENVEDNHERDAEQDPDQHDRGRKPFHVPKRYTAPGLSGTAWSSGALTAVTFAGPSLN
jgi:hypothetical protein